MTEESTTPDLEETARRAREALKRGNLDGAVAASVATWTNALIERTTTYPDIDEARAAAERLAQERG
jgi:hypothetical protein